MTAMSATPTPSKVLFFLLALAAPATIANAQSPPGDIALGHQLAAAHCQQCHGIERGGSGGWTNAPSFPDIANRPATNTARLIAVMTKPHLNMLYMPQQQPDATAIAAYILSLRQR
jgi:mono/diheme cytochrome c family protein